MTMPTVERSPQTCARVAGVLYLAIILLGLFGETIVRGSLVVDGDPAATAARIAASPMLWRAGIAGDLLMQVLDVPHTVILYLLLRPVSESLALLAAFLNMVQTAVLALNKLSLVVPLFLQDNAAYLHAFQPAQREVLAYLAIKAHGFGFAIGLVFFGFTCLILGHLIYRAGYFPKALGVLMQLAGASYLVNSFALLLAPALAQTLFPAILVPAFVGEMALCLWLIVKGVDLPRWQQRVASVATRAFNESSTPPRTP